MLLSHWALRRRDSSSIALPNRRRRSRPWNTLPQARFERPEGIAVDRSGTMYVAAPGTGLRRISPSGEVSTVRVDAVNDVPLAVALYGGANGTVVFVGTQNGLFIINPDGTRQRFPGAASTNFDTPAPQSQIEPRIIEAHRLLGFPTALTALNDHTVAFADARTNTIRVLETVHRTLRLVGGQPIEDGSGDTGAFRDGAAESSLFYSPLGITSDARGNLFIAGQQISQASSVRETRCVDTTRVNAITLFEEVQKISCERDIIDLTQDRCLRITAPLLIDTLWIRN